MLTAKKLMVPSSEEVRSEAVQTLIKRMGITKAAIFIRERPLHNVISRSGSDEKSDNICTVKDFSRWSK